MKKVLLAVFVCSVATSAMAQAPAAATGKTEDQKTLYFLGQAVSSKIKQFDFSADETKFIIQGFSEALAGQGEKLDEKVYGEKLNAYLKAKQDGLVAKEKEKAKPFLEKMSKEKGAVKLPTGVVYIPVKEGTGANPKAADMVKVHYHGTFPDGKVFDSSRDRGTPAEFPLAGVIPCWTEGVQKMKVGGQAKLVCPSETAYGDQGAGGAIPGGATLVFEVELLDIVKEAPAAAAPKAAAPAAKKEAAKPAAAKPATKK
ncbi:MAG TPA: FKBP-type peptidyl-prolyl cis-trans isomerase [Elusimicrobiales bacterium]|nr:FKBP-type peptidyl-prolyl cis-trans isomerase [Elusimicrobiales bacterium]